MTADEITRLAGDFVDMDAGNRVDPALALSREVAGMRLYERPLVAFGAADDPLFAQLRQPGVVGPRHLAPRQWLPGAQTVIALFLPATQAVRSSNAADMAWPSHGWLHARIEGQAMMGRLAAHLREALVAAGHTAVVPLLDERFSALWPTPGGGKAYTSNWSERHAAYICGLGTFGLSRGLITSRGVAGRYLCVLTGLRLPPTPRAYSGLYEYCSLCGACARNCPAQAITLEGGKDHAKCAAFLDVVMEKHRPRYGCGKCQVGVPCEAKPCPAKN